MAVAKSDASIQGLGDCAHILARGCHQRMNANTAALGSVVKRMNHSRRNGRNHPGSESGIHDNGGWGWIPKADGRKENSLHFWRYLIAKTVFSRIINADMLMKQLPSPRRRQDPRHPL